MIGADLAGRRLPVASAAEPRGDAISFGVVATLAGFHRGVDVRQIERIVAPGVHALSRQLEHFGGDR